MQRPFSLLGCAAALAVGCDRGAVPSDSPPKSSAQAAQSAAAPARSAHSPAANVATSDKAQEVTPSAPPAAAELGSEQGLIAGSVQDVGPAAPGTAAPQGVVLVARDERLLLARASLAAGRPFEATRLSPVDEAKDHFPSFSRGPAVLGDHAYWISKGRLVRRALGGGTAPEPLAPEARDGARVATAAGDGPAAAAFLARSADGARLVARLWVEGSPVLDLSPEGAAASSVALVRAGTDLVAFALEGRTAMTPVHARRIRFDHARPVLDEDVVVWVGGSAQPLTELSAVMANGRVAAVLPMEQDATHFGLVRISVPLPPSMSSHAIWQLYPNGLDPAPLATAQVCGRPIAVFARPSEVRPRSPQELVLTALDAERIGRPAVLARSRAFADVTLAASAGGALVAWVADSRTWALPLGCRSPATAK